MKRTLNILLCGLIMTLMTACSTDIVYSRFQPIPSQEWHMDSVAHFDYAITDAQADYRMLVYVRHTERYPYQNMWLFISDSLRTDTIEFYLADDRGQWLGEAHHGWIEMPVLIEENWHFPDTGVYHMTIQHGMRDTLLRGVTDVGVEIIRNGEK
ncbi:MAG: gliding motility lipoprotein GldH [Paludibacteraceae bacterium]|nr:gliding motility lipoprotein GldH [Paludibacteraceae bacterium]